MDNNEEFLNLYRRLEMYLNGKYHYADSPIKEHINRLSKSMIRSEVDRADVLDFCGTYGIISFIGTWTRTSKFRRRLWNS